MWSIPPIRNVILTVSRTAATIKFSNLKVANNHGRSGLAPEWAQRQFALNRQEPMKWHRRHPSFTSRFDCAKSLCDNGG